MKTDIYTKSVLTIIAVCLVVIVMRDLEIVPKSYATPAPPPSPLPGNVMEVKIVDISSSAKLDVNVSSLNTGNTLDVRVKEVGWNVTLPVSLDKIGNMLNPVPVKVENWK